MIFLAFFGLRKQYPCKSLSWSLTISRLQMQADLIQICFLVLRGIATELSSGVCQWSGTVGASPHRGGGRQPTKQTIWGDLHPINNSIVPAVCPDPNKRTTEMQQGRGIDPSRRVLVGKRPAQWRMSRPLTTCEHCGMTIKGNQWTVRQHQQSQRCRRARTQLPA